jgi:hypothetical protein
VFTAPSTRALWTTVLCRSAADTDLASSHANPNPKHHLCKGTCRSRASHTAGAWLHYTRSISSLKTRRHRTSAIAVTAASNAHPPPCSAAVVDTSDNANNRKSSLKHAHTVDSRPYVALAELAAADLLQYLNLLILEASLRFQ